MKRLIAYLSNKTESLKVSNREKRINLALSSAKINFEEQKDTAQVKLEELTEELATTNDVNSIIKQISEQMDIMEEAQLGIERLKKIKEYFEEDIDTGNKVGYK